MKRAVLLMVLLSACGEPPTAARESPGARLEATAIAARLIADPATASIDGYWSRDTDRVCIVPASAGARRIGVLVDYGEGQECVGAGDVRRKGDRLAIRLGDCGFEARFEGDRIVFPATMPGACQSLCTGRATLAAVAVDRVSQSVSEATTLRTSAGQPLCAS